MHRSHSARSAKSSPERAVRPSVSPGPGARTCVRSPGARSDKGLLVSGSVGKYALINGNYEPTGMHGKFPYWTSRGTNPCYIFHTGKTRWVISKELDDGTSCYAFIADDGSPSPALCRGPWTRCNDRGEWNQDPLLRCNEAPISDNPFVHMRMPLEGEMRKLKIADVEGRQVLWKKLDKNGDNIVDLAEVEALVADLVKSGTWPSWLGDNTALERAYKQTIEDSIDGDDQIEKEEFHALLLNIFWFGKLHEVFANISQNDEEIDMQEFVQGLEKLGLRFPPGKAESEFRNFDLDGSGFVSFAEFCRGVRQKVCPTSEEHRGPHAADMKKFEMAEMIEQHGGAPATSGAMVKKKTLGDFDQLEKQLKTIASEPQNKGLNKLWRRLDFNGNNKVSLAEIDKWVVESYPLLNHKPALIRAQQATLQRFKDTDGFIEKKEFKALLLNLFYFNKLFWLFDQSDSDRDRRMDLKEFQFCTNMVGLKMSPTKSQAEFARIDRNSGGIILFDEFCSYIVEKKCPPELTAFITDE
mmetsp:Transcript_87116/g.251592  ORF Transcript_87116/g.251592 Transcript_87116/m.251592 type:complete len:526 (+) Transcript_87116:67-1644(+)